VENKELNNFAGEALAEQCKKALENELGFAVPMPKFKSRRAIWQKPKSGENVEFTQKDSKEPQSRPTEPLSFSQEFDEKTSESIEKMSKQKRLSNDEFQNLYDQIWRRGPESKVQHPDNWFRRIDI